MVYMYKSINAGEFAVDHSLNTRSRDLAAVKFHRLTQTQRAVSYAGPTLWNALPTDLKSPSYFFKNMFNQLIWPKK